MAEADKQGRVKITAQQGARPAVRLVARACIALARWHREQRGEQGSPSPRSPSTNSQPERPA
jgi:hypothetical protein